ncbi:cell wall-active antibiotics response protein LiaF [Thalassobacillus devorans]|uniref:cell wall-active antibiotics response protein LiaF n=1 Tax=Thalassobacillus devorans TaxID=279813 RepID=UPI00048FF719|nr:cell wall-active antibiotics response protein LiaF [Thalassobacillus devorans]
MLQRLNTDTLNWLIIIGVFLFVLEIVFFNGELIFSVLFSGLLMYLGWKKYTRLWAKVVFWVGAVSLTFTILNMMAVRFLIVAGLILFLFHYSRSKKEAAYLKPEWSDAREPLYKVEPLFRHNFFGDQKTKDTTYQWQDINIHGAFGDRVVDLSNTVLPHEDTAVISIRHLIGNIEIYVPYEVEVSISHSAVLGRAIVFDNHHTKLINQQLAYRTEGYGSNHPQVKIITTLFSGNIEVKRI